MGYDVPNRSSKHNNIVVLEQVLKDFGKRLKQQALSNLTKTKKNNTKSLYNSIKTEVKVSKNSFQFSLSMNDYGQFVDKGVKGKTSSAKAPNSPFKFGTGTGGTGGLSAGILLWVTQKKIQFKVKKNSEFKDRKTGTFLSYKQTAMLITRSVYHKGIAPTDFLKKPFENEFKKLPKEVATAYGLEISSFLKSTLKKNK